MAPLTRMRATDDRVLTPLMKEYYGQRASVPGTLIITEGTFISPAAAGGFPNAPGIWNNEQIAAWETITDEVHRKGCFIFCQLFAMGRAADVVVAVKEGVSMVGPSALPIDEGAPLPRAMSVEEIGQTVKDFATAAENAVSPGFDGVECHGANGFLLDQFIQDSSNRRGDEYGGSIENRSRLLDDVMKAMVAAVGPERVGLRHSPWSPFQGMKMEHPILQFSDVIGKAGQLKLAYLHLVESRVSGSDDYGASERLDFAYKLWSGPLLVACAYTIAHRRRLVNEEHPDKQIVVVFGRSFVANPDLVYRVQEGLELNVPERKTFYIKKSPMGYVDYSFSAEYLAKEIEQIGSG